MNKKVGNDWIGYAHDYLVPQGIIACKNPDVLWNHAEDEDTTEYKVPVEQFELLGQPERRKQCKREPHGPLRPRQIQIRSVVLPDDHKTDSSGNESRPDHSQPQIEFSIHF